MMGKGKLNHTSWMEHEISAVWDIHRFYFLVKERQRT